MIGGASFHPILDNLSSDALVLALLPEVATRPITPADADFTFTIGSGVPFPVLVRKISVGGAGNLVYRLVGDTVDITRAVVAGQEITGLFKRIGASTTATGIVGYY